MSKFHRSQLWRIVTDASFEQSMFALTGEAFGVSDARWNARLEYLYSELGPANVVFPSGEQYGSHFDVHMIRLGLNYKLTGCTDTFTPKVDAPLQGSSDVWDRFVG